MGLNAHQKNYSANKVKKHGNEYTYPTLNKNNPNAWYIGFSFNGISCRFKLGLNRIKDLKERDLEARKYMAAMKLRLQAGDWNPLLKTQTHSEKEKTIIEALDFAMEKKQNRVSETTFYQYGRTLNFIKSAIKKLKKESLPIKELNRHNVMLILEQTAKDQKANNKGYNKYLDHFRVLLGTLNDWDVIPFNPASKVSYMPYEESIFHAPPKNDELKLILNELRTNHPKFWKYIEFYYYSGRRPDEILELKVKDLQGETIVIEPKNAKNTGKIKRYQHIVITPQLQQLIDEILKSKPNPDFYIFGQEDLPQKTVYKRGGSYLPAQYKMRMQTVTGHWRKIVKSENGLNLNVTMYAFKKLAANHKLQSGISLEAVSEFLGHTNIKTTKIYATKLEGLNRKEIIQKSKSIDDFIE